MKNILRLLLTGIVVWSTSCSDLTELNENPAKSVSLPPELLVPAIQLSHSLGYNNWVRFIAYPAGWVNHWTGPWGLQEHGGKGIKNIEYMDRYWYLMYPEAIRNLTSLESMVKDDPAEANIYAMAKLLRVLCFMKLTDHYGDIPYSEAGQGYTERKFNPRYDTQEAIYMDFFTQIDQALALFDPGKKTAQKELFFSGDVDKWIKFANSLKLRVAMRLVKVDEALAKAKAKEAFEGGLMDSNGDTAFITHQDDPQDLGPGNGMANALRQYHASYGPSTYRLTTELFTSLSVEGPTNIVDGKGFRTLEAMDPRLLLLARCYNGATYENAVDITEMCRAWNAADPNKQGPADMSNTPDQWLNIGGYMTLPAQEAHWGGGIQREGGLNKERTVWAAAITKAQVPDLPEPSLAHAFQRLQPSKWFMSSGAPFFHLSYAEVQFHLAETTLRGWGIDNETVEQRYRKGYLAAVDQWKHYVEASEMPTLTQIETYLDTYVMPELSGSVNDQMEAVMKQHWILQVQDPFEAWSLIRRTDGMPTKYAQWYNRYPAENQSNGERPSRMQYPMEEQTKNKANYDEAVARMGGKDEWTTRIWWDVKR